MNNEIYIGSLTNPSFVFHNEDLFSIDGVTAVDLVSNELSIDEFTPKIFHVFYDMQSVTYSDYDYIESSDGYVMCSNGQPKDLRTVKYGTPIWWYFDGELQLKMYVKDIERLSRDEYRINAVSAIGLIDAQYHYGGMYSGNVTVGQLISEIVNGLFPYTCDLEVFSTKVFGYLPIATKRKNLHELLLAENICLTKDSNGDVVFSFLYDDEIAPIDIPDEETFADGIVNYNAPASKVQVTEHTYQKLMTVDDVLLLDNLTEPTAVSKFVPFENPIIVDSSQPNYGLTCTGTITVVSADVNYAIINGNGTLSGKPYTHVTQVIEKVNLGVPTEKVVTLDKATLVTVANSENVANRLLSYYSSRKTISSGIVKGDRACGDKVNIVTDYGEIVTGYISKMNISATSFIKAETEIITDYVPEGSGNAYTNSVVLTGSGTWQIPSSVFQKENPLIKVILVGGGQGGGGGYKGEDGHQASEQYVYPSAPTGQGGDGGKAGVQGEGGKIFVQTINCQGLTSFAYACGSGGLGGEPSELGSEGGATTFGNHSSANGTPSVSGVINFFTGAIYGKQGVRGYDGGKGNASGSNLVIDGVTYKIGNSGQSRSNSYGSVLGGGGGGACYGKDGSNGTDAIINSTYPYRMAIGGGGNGASCDIQGDNATNYGDGGGSGHGGGGGGGNGGFTFGSSQMTIVINDPGIGGNGSRGGNGKDGCIIIYY